MVKKFALLILLFLISLSPWAFMSLAPSQAYEDFMWLVSALFSILLIFILIRWSSRKGLSHLYILDPTWRPYIGSGFIIGLLGFAFYFLVRWLLHRFTFEGTLPVEEFIPVLIMTSIYTLYIAITEEIIFRGYLLSSLREALSLKWAIVISLGLFVLLGHLPKLHHLLHSPYAIHLIAAGLVFTYAYVKTGSIGLSIGLHWGWNMGGFSEDRAFILENKVMLTWTDPLSWIYIVVDLMLLGTVMVIYRGKNPRVKAKLELTDSAK